MYNTSEREHAVIAIFMQVYPPASLCLSLCLQALRSKSHNLMNSGQITEGCHVHVAHAVDDLQQADLRRQKNASGIDEAFPAL